jgi:hypothetical protein
MRLINTARRAAAALAIMGAATLTSTESAGAAVIDFNELANPGVMFQTYASISSGGFTFTNSFNSDGRFLVWGTEHAFNGDPGGATVSHNYAGTTTTMTKDDGGTFSLLAIDFGDIYNQAAVLTIEIVGTRADMSTVVETITTDTLAGLETFLFDTLTDLISVSWTTIAGPNLNLQFDNVVVDYAVTAVPEPMTLTLLAGGLGALAFSKRHRRIA